MKRTISVLLTLALLAAAGYGAWWVWQTRPDQVRQILVRLNAALVTTEAEGLLVSGAVEADKVTVTTGTGGCIVELLVNEGDSVEAGRVVMRLDAASLEAQITQAEAAVAEAQLALANPGLALKPGMPAGAGFEGV
jgi:HlyD family secretion protein